MAQPFTEPCDEALIEAEPCPRELGRTVPRRTQRAVLAACVLASSMAFIDGSALTVALPALRADLNAEFAALQWVLNGYVVALAALTLIGGALADVYGRARMLVIGCAGFGIASVACALSQTTEALVAARIVQGVSAAILTPASLALIGAVFPKDERSAAIGVWASASALTTAAGPILGGWLTSTFGWQAVFWINPPLAIAVVLILYVWTPRDYVENRSFDVVGAAILVGALSALAWGLSQIGPGEGAGHRAGAEVLSGQAAIWTAIGLCGLALFAAWERRTAHPMTPPYIFRNRNFSALNAATLLLYAALSIMFFLLPFDLIDRRGLPEAYAGFVFLPFTVAVGVLSRPFGRLADAIGPRLLLICGALGSGAAFVGFAAGANASLGLGIIAPMAVLGVAFAVVVAPLTASVMSSVSPRDEGLASGINNTASRIAQLIGVALAAGLASFDLGYGDGMWVATGASLTAALVIFAGVRNPPKAA